MYKAITLYLLSKNDILDVDIATETPYGILYKNRELTKNKYVLSLDKEEVNDEGKIIITKNITIDLGKFFNFEVPIIFTAITKSIKELTWSDIATYLTDQMVFAYKIAIPDFTSTDKSIIFVNVIGSDEFEIAYTNIAYPSERNIKSQRWRLTDLSITKNLINESTDSVKVIKDINFDNCLACVNGIINRPIHFNDTNRHSDELLIKDGALFMSRSTEYSLPSVVLLDFSYLGNITIVPFSKCYIQNKTQNTPTLEDLKKRKKKNNASLNHNVEFIFDDPSIDLRNKTIFPVIAHSLYFPDIVTITSSNTCVIPFNTLPIKTSLLKHAAYKNSVIRYTPTVFDTITINDYISSTMSQEDHYGGFFVLVDNKDIFIKKTQVPRYVATARYNHSQDEINGILFNQTTQSFIEYTKNVYNNCTEVYAAKTISILDVDTLDTDLPYGLLDTTSKSFISSTKNFNDDDLYIINITRA